MTPETTHATITPLPNADKCESDRCNRADKLAAVDPDGDPRERVLCPEHRVDYLREVTDR